uniref:Uncharacterized protein n=1 Tax=viral metagenome TaxID=1070528 RepID=A0A6M3LJL3_9ZZZZ
MKVKIETTEERIVIYQNFVAQLKRLGYTWEAIGFEMANLALALAHLDETTEY